MSLFEPSPVTILFRAAATALTLLAVMALTGCGSSPIDRRASSGGYYQDDGPHANPPDDLALVADAVPREEPLHRFANRPYRVMGQSFTPIAEVRPFRERGRASWYGRKFHGKPTASGEPYDMYKMTAAHPTLPIPSYARVTHLGNGRSVVVRINDRGPFLHGRVIDLSYTAAYKLGYVEAGSALVEVEAIVPGELAMSAAADPVPALRRPGVAAAVAVEPMAVAQVPEVEALPLEALPPPVTVPAAPALAEAEAATGPATADGGAATPESVGNQVSDSPLQPYIQIGAFASRENASDFRSMAAEALSESPEALQIVPEGLRFRLQMGPYATVEEARSLAVRVGELLKIKPFVLMR